MSSSGPPSGPNWLGLLKWSLGHSDGTRDSSEEIRNLSDEEKSWLSQAMTELVKDEPTRMNDILTELVKYIDSLGDNDYSSSSSSSNNNNIESNDDLKQIDDNRIYDLLDELKDIVCQIDMAQVCIKFGGLKCFLCLIKGPESLVSDRIKYISCDTIATIAQNNIRVQETFYNQHVVDILCNYLLQLDESQAQRTTSSSVLIMKSKLIYSISCTIRNYSLSENHFMTHYATKIVSSALHSITFSNSCNPYLRKVLFLSSALFSSDLIRSEIKDNVFTNILIPSIFDLLCAPDLDIRDISIRLITSISGTKYGKREVFHNLELLETCIQMRSELVGKDSDVAEYEADETTRIDNMLKVIHAPCMNSEESTGNSIDNTIFLIGP